MYLASDPGAIFLKSAVDTGSQPSGYCTVSNPDLQSSSSNRFFCNGGDDNFHLPGGRNLGVLVQWNVTGPGKYSWSGAGDYVYGIVYVNGAQIHSTGTEGSRAVNKSFEVEVASGEHEVSLYFYEDCCAGLYGGWQIVASTLQFRNAGNQEIAYKVDGGIPESWSALLSPYFNKY